MDGNLTSNIENWEAGKDYPNWMDEISLSTISKGFSYPEKPLKKPIDE